MIVIIASEVHEAVKNIVSKHGAIKDSQMPEVHHNKNVSFVSCPNGLYRPVVKAVQALERLSIQPGDVFAVLSFNEQESCALVHSIYDHEINRPVYFDLMFSHPFKEKELHEKSDAQQLFNGLHHAARDYFDPALCFYFQLKGKDLPQVLSWLFRVEEETRPIFAQGISLKEEDKIDLLCRQ
ncbi:MAG TPA: hypothetical protein DHN33_10035, partial [Eubacteriaceae bacterium]|nr:hypothetical protein [Eubacteriaceae bacterium]